MTGAHGTMGWTICTVSQYDVSPDILRANVMDFETLAYINRPMVHMRGLDGPPLTLGDTKHVQVSLHGLLPWADYEMTLSSFDPVARRAVTQERGASVRSWRHEIAVDPAPQGSQLTDRVTIDAGWPTPLFALWVRVMYLIRVPRRRKMLAAVVGAKE